MSETLLLNSLASVRRKVRLLTAVQGAGRLVAAAVGLLLATVFVDYLLNLPPVPRLVVIAAAAAALVWVFARYIVHPQMARLRLSDVAGRIEETFPEFDDRLRSVVGFASTPSEESGAMKRRVVAQATDLAQQIDLQSVLRPQPAFLAMGMGAAALVLGMVLAWAAGPDYLSAALSRIFTPFEGRAWPKWTQIALVGQVPTRVASGTPLEVRMKLVKGDRASAKAIVYYQYEANGPVQQELMSRNSDGTYSASLDAHLEDGKSAGVMNVWMRSGDDGKQLPPVQVLPPLTIRQVEAVVTPPKYAQQPPSTLDLAAAPATAVIASNLELRVTFSKPLATGTPVHLQAVDGAIPAIQWDAVTAGDSTAVGHFIARANAHFKILATDADGFANSGIEEFQVLVHPDQLPSVVFEKPVRNLETTADAAVQIQAAAEDDFGISRLQMKVRRLSDNKDWTIDLIKDGRPASDDVQWRKLDGAGDRLRFRTNWDWELAKLDDANLKPGDQLEFYLRVQDNYQDEQGRPHDPAFSESGRLRLTIITQDELSQELTDQLSQLRAQVDETRKQNEGLRSGTRNLQQDTQNKAALDRADRAMARQLANDQGAAASQTKQIADRLGDMLERLQQNRSPNAQMADNVQQAQRMLNTAAEDPMKNAAAQLSQLADQQNQQNQNQQAGQDQNPQNSDQQNPQNQNAQDQNAQGQNQQNQNARNANQQNQQGQNGQNRQGQQNQNGQNQNAQNQSRQNQGSQGQDQQNQQNQNAQSGQNQSEQNQQTPAQRKAALDQTQQQQQQASAQLQNAMDKMGQDAGLSQFLKQVADLLEKQRNLSQQTAQAGKDTLGKDESQLSDQEKNALANLANQQRDLAKEADQQANKMNDAADKQARTDPATSQALKQAAQTAQQQNVSGQMNQAAQAEQQNQQANAQTGQRQAELGLLMMMNQLKEAENRRLAELMRQLETAQELVGDLLEQQAGHNLDNLTLQGGTALADAVKADPELIKDLIDFSNRDAQHLPEAPALETQIALQAQTERNTRNIVSVVQALPDGADPSDQLTRAAQRMSRAVAYLEDKKLTDAYQPPQADAFASLLSAKQELDKQANDARQQMQDQRKETLREQFVQIRDAQVKINDRTKGIAATPRTDDGQLSHAARANLGITADQQTELAKTTAKLNDALTAIGSVSYAYANNDITDKMTQSAAALGKLDPGTATQHTQDRVVRELDDMIKNLAMRPRQSQFSNPRNGGAQGQGQGQGQQQPPHLPPEAEIRLIQDMQKMLNEDTKDADAAVPQSKQAVLDLGKRQGDLRKLLDDILTKSSEGKVTLGPEPDNKDTLPEEAQNEDLDLQELKDSALNATPDTKGIADDTSMLGIRMARARQRLALNADPGVTTQKIQDRIIIEMDSLASMAQQQQANAQPSSSRQRGQQRQNMPGQPRPGDPGNQQAQGQRSQGPQANNPANQQQRSNPGGNTTGLTEQDINAQVAALKESWGKLSPRQRAAVMEGDTDQTIQKFKDFVDGYYRTLSLKNNNPQP
jgi:hypothetical protein